MNWLKSFLGLYDKARVKKSERVDQYVIDQTHGFNKEMALIKRSAKSVHERTRQAHEDSAKLIEYVDDVVNKIAIATGGRKIKHG